MTWTLADAELDAYQEAHGYRLAVFCQECGKAWSVQMEPDGDPREPDAMNCDCGGRGEPL